MAGLPLLKSIARLFFSVIKKENGSGKRPKRMEAWNRKRNRFHLTRAREHLENNDTHRALRHLNKCRFGGSDDAGDAREGDDAGDAREEQEAEEMAKALELKDKLKEQHKAETYAELARKVVDANARMYYDPDRRAWYHDPDRGALNASHRYFEFSPPQVHIKDGRFVLRVKTTLVKRYNGEETRIGVSPIDFDISAKGS